jgi:hypothetical protein
MPLGLGSRVIAGRVPVLSVVLRARIVGTCRVVHRRRRVTAADVAPRADVDAATVARVGSARGVRAGVLSRSSGERVPAPRDEHAERRRSKDSEYTRSSARQTDVSHSDLSRRRTRLLSFYPQSTP